MFDFLNKLNKFLDRLFDKVKIIVERLLFLFDVLILNPSLKYFIQSFTDPFYLMYTRNYSKIKDMFYIFIISVSIIYFAQYVPTNYKNPEAIYSYLPVLKYLSIPFIALFHIILINKNNIHSLRLFSIYWSIVLLLFIPYLNYYASYCVINLWKTEQLFSLLSFIKINRFVAFYGIDSVGLIFLTLNSTIFCLIFVYLTNSISKNYKNILILLYIIYIMLIQIFTTENLFVFFFFFESIVFPLYFIIISDGSRYQKFKAANYFFFFTVLGSLFMFLAINYLLIHCHNINIHVLMKSTIKFNPEVQKLLWLAFFFSFAIKIPMFPFHTWLPEAHVEAPTYASVLLAGVLLKLGIFGFLRIQFILFPAANSFYADYVIVLACISIMIGALNALRQVDVKRIIAYASVSHMNMIVLGLYCANSIGIYGSIFQCVSHAYVASALFFSIGILYERYKTRLYYYFGGLALSMPGFSVFFLIYTLANISFPLTSNFIGELFIFLGLSKLHLGLVILAISSIIISTAYSLWIANRMLFGNLKTQYLNNFKDLTIIEIVVLLSLLILIFILGVYPNIFFYFIPEQNIEYFINFITILFNIK